MDRMLYLAMSGARQMLQAQAANSNNLANLSTPGFRADLVSFRSMPVFGPGLPTRVYALEERPGVNLQPGPVHTTGNPLDIAIDGKGFIAVQGPDGKEAYTRAGDLRLSPNGLLETGSGDLVLGNGGPIAVPPEQQIAIGADGTVSVRPLGQGANALTTLDRIKLVNPPASALVKGADGLFRLASGKPAPADASVQVTSGALEGSNVNAVQALVQMIELARGYEMQVKLMNQAKQNDQSAAQVLTLA